MNLIKNESRKSKEQLISNAEVAERRLLELKQKLEEIKNIKVEEKIIELTNENKALKIKVENTKANLINLEILHGKKQYVLPTKCNVKVDTQFQKPQPEVKTDQTNRNIKKVEEAHLKNKLSLAKLPAATIDSIVDIRKLDLRIGKIIDVKKHPDADSLYVEKIDCGEEHPRTVVSGLVKFIPIEEMRERFVMVLCNLKPVKMRGVTSEAMVMCASTPEKVEVLNPPIGVSAGDLVLCEGYPREPEPLLNPKKKVFETCAPDLKTNAIGVACYKDSPLIVPGKGPVTALTLKGVNVK